MVRRPDRAKLCSSVSARFAQDLEKIFMPDVLSNIMLLDAFGLFEIFVGAWRLYIFARRPTNSRGGTGRS